MRSSFLWAILLSPLAVLQAGANYTLSRSWRNVNGERTPHLREEPRPNGVAVEHKQHELAAVGSQDERRPRGGHDGPGGAGRRNRVIILQKPASGRLRTRRSPRYVHAGRCRFR